MAFTEHHPGATRRKRLQRAVLIAFAIKSAIAIECDGIVRAINYCEMDELTRASGLGRGVGVLGASKKIAPGNPMTRFLFAKDDRVEVLAIRRLHGQRRSPPLIEPGQSHPDFQCFFTKAGRKRFGDDPLARILQDKAARPDHSATFGSAVHRSNGIAQIFVETPSSQR